MAGEEILVAVAVGAAVASGLMVGMIGKRYKRVGMNQAMVVYGAPRGDRAWTVVGPGGGRFIRPIVEQVKFLSLHRHTLRLPVLGGVTKSGASIHVNLVAVVGISSDRAMLDRAVEALIGKPPDEMDGIAREAIETSVKRVCSEREGSEITGDIAGLSAAIREDAKGALFDSGIEVFSLTVRDFSPDTGFADDSTSGRGPPMKALVVGRDV